MLKFLVATSDKIEQVSQNCNFIQNKFFKGSQTQMKGNQQQFVPNKKLILHFDVDGVLRLPSRKNKDLYVYDLCSGWVWGKLEKNSKQDPNKVTGWKLVSNSLSKEQPEPDTLTYRDYLKQYVKPDANEWENLILNLSKGPAAKAKGQIEKTIKNITIPKTLHDVLKESKPERQLEKIYVETGKYEILPSFYKLFLSLKKNKREFAIVVKSDKKDGDHTNIIDELNLFFTGQHPLYNGKNGTPLVKMDGTNKCKNFVYTDANFGVIYSLKHGAENNEVVASFGTYHYAEEKDPDMLKQSLKSNKKIKVCEQIGEIYAYSHTILAESAFIYEINPTKSYFIDEVDYLTQQIFFSTSAEPQLYNVLGEKVSKTSSFFELVDEFEMLRDVDYFIKKVEKKEEQRAVEVQKIQRGEENEPAQDQNAEDLKASKNEANEVQESDDEYLKRTIIPLLDGAFRQVDLFRPDDPVGFIALYCLKNKDLIK